MEQLTRTEAFPGNWDKLLTQCGKPGPTCSPLGLPTHRSPWAYLMVDIMIYVSSLQQPYGDATAFPDIIWAFPGSWKLKVKIKVWKTHSWTLTAQKLRGIYKCLNKPSTFSLGDIYYQPAMKGKETGKEAILYRLMLSWWLVMDKQERENQHQGRRKPRTVCFTPPAITWRPWTHPEMVMFPSVNKGSHDRLEGSSVQKPRFLILGKRVMQHTAGPLSRPGSFSLKQGCPAYKASFQHGQVQAFVGFLAKTCPSNLQWGAVNQSQAVDSGVLRDT